MAPVRVVEIPNAIGKIISADDDHPAYLIQS
jgi:hypothetical protein